MRKLNESVGGGLEGSDGSSAPSTPGAFTPAATGKQVTSAASLEQEFFGKGSEFAPPPKRGRRSTVVLSRGISQQRISSSPAPAQIPAEGGQGVKGVRGGKQISAASTAAGSAGRRQRHNFFSGGAKLPLGAQALGKTLR